MPDGIGIDGEIDGLGLEPELSPREREELSNVRYYEEKLAELCDRGLIAQEARAEIVAECRTRAGAILDEGRVLAGMNRARSLMTRDPGAAVDLAGRVRAAYPGSSEAAWSLVRILWGADREAEALARYDEEFARFPELSGLGEWLRDEQEARAEARLVEAEAAEQKRRTDERLALAKQALEAKRDDEVVALCDEVLDLDPENVEAIAFSAFSLQRSGKLAEALDRYRVLRHVQPGNDTWKEWVRELEGRLARPKGRVPAAEASGVAAPVHVESSKAIPVESGPRISWSSVAGEFVQEHWQKLILCLAVLLIVVSSTIGAHVLLGPRLWSPVGKCALALMITSLFAALGISLSHWGAARAGRIMLVTTLIVAPIHFMLAGELGLLSHPSAAGLGLAVVDLLAIVGLTRAVSGRIAPPREAWFLTSSIALVSASNAVAARDLSSRLWPIGAFEAPAIIFFLATGWLGRHLRAKPAEGSSDDEGTAKGGGSAGFVPLALGLLSFAMLASVLRIGGYELGLEPAFFGVPLMLAAGACLLLSGQTRGMKADDKILGWLKLIGFSLSALAFALVLARGQGSPKVFDGNTLAVSLMGLTIYAATLRIERHPAYLYLAIATLALAAVAFLDVVVGPDRPLEVALGRMLGYPGKPPFPFRAVQMIGLNAVLAGLSVWFSKKWDDDRLSWHCDAIGLALSVVACILSGFEPKAAVICLPIYSVFYLTTARLFEMPPLTYLGISALAGAVYFVDRLVDPYAGFGASSIEATAFGFACWGVAMRLGRAGERDPQGFRLPWLHGSLALCLVALALAICELGNHEYIQPISVGMFAAISSLLVVLTREFPAWPLAHLTLAAALVTWIGTIGIVKGPRDEPVATGAIAVLCYDLILLGIAAVGRVRASLPSIARAIPNFAVATALLTMLAQLTNLGESRAEPLAIALGAVVLLGTARPDRRRWRIDLGLACSAAAVANLTWWIAPHGLNNGLLVGWEGIAAGLLALAFYGAARFDLRRGHSAFFARPCLQWAFLMTAVAFGLAIEARGMAKEAYVLGVAGLTLDCAVILLIGHSWRSAFMTYYAVAAIVAATYVLLLSMGEPDPRNSHVLGTIAVSLSLVFWWVGFACRRLREDWVRMYGYPLQAWSLLLTAVAVPLAYWSPTTMAMASFSFLLMVESFPLASWLYLSVGCLGASAYYGYFLDRPWSTWLIGLLGAAYGLWALALVVGKGKAAICRLFGLEDRRYEFVLADSAVVFMLLAVWARVAWSVQTGLDATAYPGFPLAVAGLAFLMRAPYHRPIFVHAGLACLTWFLVTIENPSLQSATLIGLGGSFLAFLLALAALALTAWSRNAPAGFEFDMESRIARGWSFCLWVGSLSVASAVIAMHVTHEIVPELWEMALAIDPRARSRLIQVLMLSGFTFNWLVFNRPDDSLALGSIRLTKARMGCFEGLLFVWVFVIDPPTWGSHISPQGLLPIATAAYGLAILALLALRNRRAAARSELVFDLDRGPVDPFIEGTVLVTAILGALFTRGAVDAYTVATLVLSSASLGWLGASTSAQDVRTVTSYGAPTLWTAALGMAGLEIARRLGLALPEQRCLAGAAGIVVADASLLVQTSASRRLRPEGGGALPPERVAFLGTLAATACVAYAAAFSRDLGPQATFAGVGILAAIASMYVALAKRWNSEGLVYLAQGMLLGAYAVYRQAFPAPVATDAVLLTLVAYLDLGIAETLDRLRLPLYSRPTRLVSFLLPLLPLIPMLSAGKLDQVGVFHLLAAGTFYGVSFSMTRWRFLGYAAAVLYNAALWVWWSQLGWTMADHPQFYFVPVGLSAVVFAEAHRRAIGIPAVNAIRAVGLILVYLTAAVPMRGEQSFGAWLTLLILSLVGIFAGIGLRVRVFLWLGLSAFLLDVLYQLARFSADHAFAKWAIMLSLGIGLVLFVALNEKKQIIGTIRKYYEQTRGWE